MAVTIKPRAQVLLLIFLNLVTLSVSTTTISSNSTEYLQTPSNSTAKRLRLEDCAALPNDPYGVSHVPFIYGPGWILAWIFIVFNTLIQAFYTNDGLTPDAIYAAVYPLVVVGDVFRQVFSMSGIAMEQAKQHYARLAVSLFILSANWNFIGVWSIGYMLVKLICPDYLPEPIRRLSRWPALFVYGQIVSNALVAFACGLIAWVFERFDGLKVTEMQVFGYLPQMTVWTFGICMILLYTPYFDEERIFGLTRGDYEDEYEDDDDDIPKRSFIGSIFFGFFKTVHIVLYFVIYITSWLSAAVTFCAPILFFLCLPILILSYTTISIFSIMQLIPAGLGFTILSYRLLKVGFWRFLLSKFLLMLGSLFATMGWSRYK